MDIRPQPGPQEQFLATPADIAIYGGAAGGGKTYALLIEPLRHITTRPGFGAVIFRRNAVQIRNEGGLWDESESVYPLHPIGAVPRENTLDWTFPPHGNTLSFAHLEYDSTVYSWQGAQICFIGFDELTHFCVDPETEVLTADGWKRIPEVEVGDRVASLSPSRDIEYRPVVETNTSTYRGEMISVEQPHGINALMTPNHNVVVNVADNVGKTGKAKYGSWKLRRADSLKTCSVPRTGAWSGEEVDTTPLTLPTGRGHGPNSNAVPSIQTDDWLQFLGWFMSEGCSFQMKNRTGSPVISLRQTKEDGKVKIREVLDKLPWKHGETRDGQFRICSRQLFDIVHPWGNAHIKRVPRWIFGLPPRQISLFLDCFADGDGHRTTSGGIQISLSNEGLIDDLQELYFLCGRVAAKGHYVTQTGFDVWSLSVSRPARSHCFVKADQWKRVPYDGLVHCITVAGNGNFLARRNGRYHWTGNSKRQFFYMLSRNRSLCGVRPYIRATTNPDADSWVAEFIGWWIDQETGLPIPERSGVLRWMVRVDDLIVWGDTAEELTAQYPGSQPKSVTFIPATLADNRILEREDPGYRANLMALSYVDQQRLLHGNWKVKPTAGTVFKREWLEVVDHAPHSTNRVRFWDTAATKPSARNRDPDYTAGLLMSEVGGEYYIEDVVRIRETPGETDRQKRAIAAEDGHGVRIRDEQEGGSSGKTAVHFAARDTFAGYDYIGVPATGSKEVRARPVAAAAYNHLIKIIRAPWNEALLAELHSFPDGPHDDQVDALAGAFTDLVLNRPGATVPLSAIRTPPAIPTLGGQSRTIPRL